MKISLVCRVKDLDDTETFLAIIKEATNPSIFNAEVRIIEHRSGIKPTEESSP